MAVTKQDIAAALNKLDPTNAAHWTDDGSPRVDVVQGLANDKGITRAAINDALPGFDRAAAQGDGGTVLKTATTGPAVDNTSLDDLDLGLDDDPAKLDVRAVLENRVSRASEAVDAALKAAADATAAVHQAHKRLERAQNDLIARFPPMTAAENIKQHLARQQELLTERVAAAGGFGRGQLDLAMEQRRSRGWSRPARPVATGV